VLHVASIAPAVLSLCWEDLAARRRCALEAYERMRRFLHDPRLLSSERPGPARSGRRDALVGEVGESWPLVVVGVREGVRVS
jgi:hypothetical protein